MLDFVAQPLVEPTWLAAHLYDEEVRVIDARWRGDGPGTVPAGAPARGGPPGLAARPELDGRARSGVPAHAARTLRGGHGSGGDRGPDARGRLCRNGPLRSCSALVGAALLRPRPGGRPQWRVDQVGGRGVAHRDRDAVPCAGHLHNAPAPALARDSPRN